MLARLIVALRFLIVPAWLLAAVWVSLNLPSVFASEASEIGSLLPRNSEALRVEEELRHLEGLRAGGPGGPARPHPPALGTAAQPQRAARAITVAGMILALSFAAVALIPIEAFRQLAFAMFVGLLIDTLLARTLLIPALVSLFGRE